MYVLYHGELYNAEELYHYGVPGMKWGKRKAERAYSRKLTRAGVQQGRADYNRQRGEEEYQKHESKAKVFDKVANKYESEGKYFRAEAARNSASALRKRGANVQSRWNETAMKYQLKADKLNQKASTFASKKRVEAGKDIVDEIFSRAREKGISKARRDEEWTREMQLRERLGDEGYAKLRKLQGF